MPVSYFDYPETQNYTENDYRWKEIEKGKFLVTTYHGAWALLSRDEFDQLRYGKVNENPDLCKKLEELGVIITEKNARPLLSNYSDRFAHLFNNSSLHIVTITLRCTNRCLYCYASPQPPNAKEYDMTKSTAKKVVDFVFQSPAQNIAIEFQGGEPLFNYPVIRYITEYSKKLNRKHKKKLCLSVVTNLALMRPDILRYLVGNAFNLCTSLDGPQEVHDKNRKFFGGGGTYKKVTYWINEIKNIQEYSLHALPVITKFSLPYYKEIIDEYLKWGLDRIRLKNILRAGLARKNWDKIGYTPQQYIDFWKKALDYCLELNKNGTYFLEGTTVLIARKLLSKDYQAYTCLGNPCGACLTQTSYNYDGSIYSCDEAKSFEAFKIGDVRNDSYKGIYASPRALNIVSLSSCLNLLCDSCVWFPYCNSCMVSTYGSQGTPIPKLPLDDECRIRSAQIEHIIKKLLFSEEDRKVLLHWCSTRKGV